MKLGFTGTQGEMTREQRWILIQLANDLPISEVHHGGCHGADLEFHNIFSVYRRHIHPGPNSYKYAEVVYPTKPYLERNKDIVNSCDLLVACPSGPEILRSGTWATIRYARKVNKPHIILMP